MNETDAFGKMLVNFIMAICVICLIATFRVFFG